MVNVLDTISSRTSDAFRAAQGAVRGGLQGDPAGFSNLDKLPSPSGNNVRQAKIANLRDGSAVRNMVRWFLPEVGIVEMYINPKSIKYSDKKHIPSPTRTRGGYLIQYWGEELGSVSLAGTTGSSGIEGINVLYDIYRSEQVALDGLALAVQASRDRDNLGGGLLSGIAGNGAAAVGNVIGGITDTLFDQVDSLLESGNIDPVSPRPTLASMAFQVEMYWAGAVYRGYFTQMTVNESADNIGLFDYNIDFMVTQKRGLRLNFMPWHRSAVNGPSNSDPAFGPPYSFGTLKDPLPGRTLVENQQQLRRFQTVRTLNQGLQSSRPL